MKLSQNQLENIQKVFDASPVKRAYIFGSFSKGTANESSDIDILVELDYSKHIGLAFIGLKNKMEEVLEKSVDLVTDKGLSKHILPFVEREKILIYER